MGAQTPTLLIDDSARIKQHEQLEMVPESSGPDTDQETYMTGRETAEAARRSVLASLVDLFPDSAYL